MSNSKNTSSNQQGKSSTSDNFKNKSVTHTDHRSKTKSNSITNSTTDDYKYIPGADRPTSDASENKRPSSGNIRGV